MPILYEQFDEIGHMIESVLEEVIFLNEGRVTLHENCDVLREKHNKSIDELFREEFKW